MVSSETTRPQSYLISHEELSSPPAEIEAYKFGDRVVRATLAPFLATGIQSANGIDFLLGYYCEKVEFDTGLNITATAREMVLAGGLEVLSEGERSIIFEAYRSTFPAELTDDQILKILNNLFTPQNYKDRSRRLPKNARALQGQEFIDWLNNKSLEERAADTKIRSYGSVV